MQVVSNMWHVQDAHGNNGTMSGRGVNNSAPILAPKSRAFQYVGAVTLATPSGAMGFGIKMSFENSR